MSWKKGSCLIIITGLLAMSLSSCETVKGAANGARKDVDSLQGPNGLDTWIQENLW